MIEWWRFSLRVATNVKELADKLMRILKTILLIIVTLCAKESMAQYYSWGSDAPMKWSKIEGDKVQVIYPDTVSGLAYRVLNYINAVQDDISYGFNKGALDIPFVMRPENFAANGLVMWMPKRVEFLSTPSTDSYSMLWSKQLVAHEYRHAVQYNNLNNGFVKVLSYILGQQGSAAGFAFMPLFAMEGDAVMIETQMSTYGRGLQPSFTMEYRAIGDDMLSHKNMDKWVCGSYRKNIPDHYKFGYQFMSYAQQKYGENIWNKAIEYATTHPYMIVSPSLGLRKFYGANVETIARETFVELNDFWRAQRSVPNSTQIVSKVDTTNYTTYSHPIVLEEGGGVLSLKTAYDKTSRFVVLDDDDNEHVVLKTGSVSTRPSLGGGRVWWTEYRRSLLFDEKVNSQLCYMDLSVGRSRRVRGVTKALYAEAMSEDISHVSYVEYAPSGQYTVVERKGDEELRRLRVKFPAEIHGLAWDDKTQKLYIIVTDDSGMWLGVESGDGFEQLHEGRYITISNLRAKGGVLYFGSIASGLDEMHSFDIASGVETQITSSTYGSFQPSSPQDEYIYGTTYDKYGYHLSRQKSSEVVGEITPGNIPHNKVNPERQDLGLVNIDNVRFTEADSVAMSESCNHRKYSKASHLVDIHSWLPLRINPFELLDEQTLDVGLGATILSQNKLSSSEGFLSYGYDFDQGSLVNGAIYYTGWGVNLGFGVSYGGDRQIYNFGAQQPEYSMSKYLSFSASASLPLYFQRGYWTRQLTLSAGWNYSNGMVLDLHEALDNGDIAYSKWLNKLTLGVGFGSYARTSYRDFAIPLGYSVSLGYSTDPTNRDFSTQLSSYAKLYLPGILPHNSLTIAASYQTNVWGYRINGYAPLGYKSVYILPQGYTTSDVITNNYIASTVDYQFPVWYPDGGIDGFMYFRRLRLKGGFEYAQFDDYEGGTQRIYSYGGGVVVDINFFRMPSSGTSAVEFSIYKPKGRGLSYKVGVSLPL